MGPPRCAGRPSPPAISAQLTTRAAVREMLRAGVEELVITGDGTLDGALESILTASELALFCGHNPVRLVRGIQQAASAADGIKRKLTPPAAVEGDAYSRDDLPELPGSLESAIGAFGADSVLRQALGERFSDYYVTSRAWEVKAFRGTVTDWERDRYMRTV